MGCGQDCMKILLIVFNVIFFLLGAAIVGVGLFVRLDPNLINEYAEKFGIDVAINEKLFSAVYVLIAFGGITFLIGFLGCCGAMQKSKVMIGLYVTFVLLIMIAEVVGGVIVYPKRYEIIDDITDIAYKNLHDNYKDSNSPPDLAWNEAMKKLKCCGVNGVSDFQGSAFQKQNSSNIVPSACCKEDGSLRNCIADARRNVTSSVNLHTDGCLNTIEDLIENNSVILLGVGIGVAAFELFVVIIGIAFACSIEK